MRNYNWDIRDWLIRLDWRLRNRDEHIAWLYVILKPLTSLHARFLDVNASVDYRVLFNSQQRIFSDALNDLFDSEDRRIRVVTGTDDIPRTFTYYKSEVNTPRYAYYENEAGTERFTFFTSESAQLAKFIVYVPSALSGDETRIRAWINYYKLADKTYTIIYE